MTVLNNTHAAVMLFTLVLKAKDQDSIKIVGPEKVMMTSSKAAGREKRM